jgi:NRPS condensation-like uncharacterized protein
MNLNKPFQSSLCKRAEPSSIRLNYADFIYLTMEDVNLSQGNLVMLRFKEKHPVEEIREAMRYLVTIYPRMRSLLEPTLFSYQLRILNDNDERLDLFFNNAFRVIPQVRYDSPEFLSSRRNFYNEPFSLLQTIPLKICYFPDDPTPVLMLSIHHVVGDGSAVVHMIGSLMAYLNGKRSEPFPVDDPSLLPALMNRPWHNFPSQLYRSIKLLVQDSKQGPKGRIIPATDKPVFFFGPVDIHQYVLKHDLSLIRTMARELGVSITTIILTALAISLTQGRNIQGDIAGIIVSVNLRPFFPGKKPVIGNFITGFMIKLPRAIWDDHKAMINEVHSQMTHKLERIEQKQNLVSGLAAKMSTLIGKKNYARVIRLAKQAGILSKTGALANLGSVDGLNSFGKQAQICEFLGSGPSHGLFVSINTLESKLFVSYTYQEAEFTRAEVQACMSRFEESLGNLINKNTDMGEK